MQISRNVINGAKSNN